MSGGANDLFLIDLRIKPCAYVQEVIEGSFKKLSEGTEYSGGHHYYSFKISGENRIISLVSGDPEAATLLQSKAYGELSDINCTLIRPYEVFADKQLHVTKSLTDLESKLKAQEAFSGDKPGNIYWMVVTWEHTGMNFGDMLKVAGEQAAYISGLKKKGELVVNHQYKTIGACQTHSFIKTANSESLDNYIFNFPLVKRLGSQVKINLKQVHLLTDKTYEN